MFFERLGSPTSFSSLSFFLLLSKLLLRVHASHLYFSVADVAATADSSSSSSSSTCSPSSRFVFILPRIQSIMSRRTHTHARVRACTFLFISKSVKESERGKREREKEKISRDLAAARLFSFFGTIIVLFFSVLVRTLIAGTSRCSRSSVLSAEFTAKQRLCSCI